MEKLITIYNTEYAIPAVFSYSQKHEKMPAVILCHGTGSQKNEVGNCNSLNPQLCWGEWNEQQRYYGQKKPPLYNTVGFASHCKAKEAVRMDNQSLSHTKWKCQFHVVFIPKYRRKVMYGKVKKDVQA